MGEWKKTSIEEIASVNMGQSPDSNFVNEVEFGTPFLQGNAEFGTRTPEEIFWCTRPRKTAQKGDILVSVRAPVGAVNIADKEYCIGRGLAAVNFWGINKEFSSYAFSNVVPQLHIKSQGTTFLAVSKGDIDKAVISYPISDAEQSKIAEVLFTVDEAIDNTRNLIEKYKNIKAGMTQDLLGNGIDEKGVLRTPETHEYKDSPLGMIPIEWDCVPLGTICDCITKLAGFEYSKYFNSYNDGGEIIVVRGTNITNNKIDLSDVKNIPRKTSEMLPRSQLHKGDLVFAYVGTIGPIWLIDEDGKYHLGPNTAKITVKSDIDVDYMHQYFTSRLIGNEITLQMSVGAQPSLSMTKIRKFRILKPKLKSEQTHIAELLTTADVRIQTERAYLTKLQDIKLGLMQDLLTNTVSVDALL